MAQVEIKAVGKRDARAWDGEQLELRLLGYVPLKVPREN